MAISQWSPLELFKRFGKILGRKMAFVAVGWLIVYFITQPMRQVPTDGGVNILTLFGPVIGGLAGLIAGWHMATDAVEDSSMHGITLWVVLVAAAVIPMWVVEGIMRLFTHWPMNFGGFMVLLAANLLALASAVWLASSQE
jgi:hypothetical protein